MEQTKERVKRKRIGRILKRSLIGFASVLLLAIALFFIIRAIGIQNYKNVPEDGICESMKIPVNGTKEWISIYGQNKDNPVLLVIHGGPGSCQSPYAYEYQKDWSDVYTVVTWDQRGCGLSYDKNLKAEDITFELMMSDCLVVIDYLREHLGVDKITLLGYSWGTMLGAKLAYEYPEYFDSYIAAGQLVDTTDNETAFVNQARLWAKDDSKGLALLEELSQTPLGTQHYTLKNEIMNRYGYAAGSNGLGFNYYKAIYYNPYYSIADFYQSMKGVTLYNDFINSDEFNTFTINDQMEYQIPCYFICGDMDYQTNYQIANAYYDKIQAPDKEYYLISNCTHSLMEEKTDKFTEIIKQIAKGE